MPINPLIALQAQAPDITGFTSGLISDLAGVQRMKQQAQLAPLEKSIAEEKLAQLQAQGEQQRSIAGLKNLSERDTLRLQRLGVAAQEVKPLLDSGDIEGAKLWAQNRMATLQKEGIDQNETAPFLRTLEKGDIETAKSQVNTILELSGAIPTIKPIEQEKLDLRRLEIQQRELDRQSKQLDRELQQETNTLRRQEIQQKIDKHKVEMEKSKREQEFQAESAIANFDNTILTIEQALEGDGLESAAGAESNLPTLGGTPAATFEARLETIQSQAFLNEVEKMKGLGALSENEGKKLTAAIGSLSLTMEDKELRKEMRRIMEVMKQANERVKKKFGVTVKKPDRPSLDQFWTK